MIISAQVGKAAARVILFIIVFLLGQLNLYAGDRPAEGDKNLIIDVARERLVARDVGRGGAINMLRWCGNNALLFSGDNIGIEALNFVTGKSVQISANRRDLPLNCSPDGRWALYVDRAISRMDKGPGFESDEDVEISAWDGGIADIFRYELATGKRERAAVIRDQGTHEALSPDGKKILLGSRHNSIIPMPVSDWQPVWFDNEWGAFNFQWLSDSSGVVGLREVRFGENGLAVKIVGDKGVEKVFEIMGGKYGSDIGRLRVGKDNSLYLWAYEKDCVWKDFKCKDCLIDDSRCNSSLYRCVIKDKELSCEKAFEYVGWAAPYEILPNGDMIFYDDISRSILQISPPLKKPRRILDRQYMEEQYGDISLQGISADGKWLVYERTKMITTPQGGFSHHQEDLFVIELAK